MIQNPRRYTHSTYDKWLGEKKPASHRDILRADIDAVLTEKPKDFEELLDRLRQTGWEVSAGRTSLSVKAASGPYGCAHSVRAILRPSCGLLSPDMQHISHAASANVRALLSTLRQSWLRAKALAMSAGRRCST